MMNIDFVNLLLAANVTLLKLLIAFGSGWLMLNLL
jgi:hypothetical protein